MKQNAVQKNNESRRRINTKKNNVLGQLLGGTKLSNFNLPPSSWILITKYLLESITCSTATPGYASTGHEANSSPTMKPLNVFSTEIQNPEKELDLMPSLQKQQMSRLEWLQNFTNWPTASGAVFPLLTWYFVFQFQSDVLSFGHNTQPASPVWSIQFPISSSGNRIQHVNCFPCNTEPNVPQEKGVRTIRSGFRSNKGRLFYNCQEFQVTLSRD